MTLEMEVVIYARFADTIFNDIHDENYSFLSEDEVLDLKHDIAWCKHLYELHTHAGSMSITPELAATLSLHDLECLIIYPTPKMIDTPNASILVETHSVCMKELTRRETQLEFTKD